MSSRNMESKWCELYFELVFSLATVTDFTWLDVGRKMTMYHADNWQLRREGNISKLTLSTLYLRINMYLVQGWLFQEIFF